MDLTSIALNQALDYLGTFSPALYDEAQRIRHTLDAPPRIVVVGRLKSGKSTLVNALIGAPVAETAVSKPPTWSPSSNTAHPTAPKPFF